MSRSEEVLKHVEKAYVEPARQRGEPTIQVRAGDVHRDLRWTNRVPSVCTALASQKLQKAIGAELIGKQGPPSGFSTSVVYTYRLPSGDKGEAKRKKPGGLDELYGIAADVFRELGGGENFIRTERENFDFRYEAEGREFQEKSR